MANSLGRTAQETYRNWEKAKPGPGQIVLGRITLVGSFSWLDGRIIKHERTGRGVATYRPANAHELEEIEWAIQNGAVQIEAVPVQGIVARNDRFINTEVGCYIYHQATGQKLEIPDAE